MSDVTCGGAKRIVPDRKLDGYSAEDANEAAKAFELFGDDELEHYLLEDIQAVNAQSTEETLIEAVIADRDLLLQAVNIIAGNAQCADNLLSHKEIALEALRIRK